MNVISLMGTTNQNSLTMPKNSTIVTIPSTVITNNNNHESSPPLTIDFNDPSTTNFLLSALASGASSDSNAIVNHLYQVARTQQRTQTSTASSNSNNTSITSSGLKTYTQTTNLLPSLCSSSITSQRSSSSSTTTNECNQQSSIPNNHTDDKKRNQQVVFIDKKSCSMQQKLTYDQTLQQRLTPISLGLSSNGLFNFLIFHMKSLKSIDI